MIGVHLIVDGVFEPPLGREEILGVLSGLPSEIDMKILSGPVVVEGVPENPGWTGFVIIDKSHISIHTFEEGNKISMDVFSCKPFDAEAALGYIRENISLKRINWRVLERSED